MRDFVIDANILISILISGKASYKTIVENFNFYSPDFVFEEIEKYKSTILEKSKLNNNELKLFSIIIFNKINVFPNYIISKEAIGKAYSLTKNIDIKDLIYVALSIELDLVLLTRDKKLKASLNNNGYRKCIIFDDFIANLK